jgi:hypothetical protein
MYDIHIFWDDIRTSESMEYDLTTHPFFRGKDMYLVSFLPLLLGYAGDHLIRNLGSVWPFYPRRKRFVVWCP